MKLPFVWVSYLNLVTIIFVDVHFFPLDNMTLCRLNILIVGKKSSNKYINIAIVVLLFLSSVA